MIVEFNERDCRALRRGIERDFNEGTLEEWPSESVMRAIGFDEKHWMWSYFARGIASVGGGSSVKYPLPEPSVN